MEMEMEAETKGRHWKMAREWWWAEQELTGKGASEKPSYSKSEVFWGTHKGLFLNTYFREIDQHSGKKLETPVSSVDFSDLVGFLIKFR